MKQHQIDGQFDPLLTPFDPPPEKGWSKPILTPSKLTIYLFLNQALNYFIKHSQFAPHDPLGGVYPLLKEGGYTPP